MGLSTSGEILKAAALSLLLVLGAFLFFAAQAKSPAPNASSQAADAQVEGPQDAGPQKDATPNATPSPSSEDIAVQDQKPDAPQSSEGASVVVAGGCFWCVEADFEKLKGVSEAISGYSGGSVYNPTYKQVTNGNTGHLEAVEIRYDPAKIDFRTLVRFFFRHIDPTDPDGQFCDKGPSYRTAIFTQSAEERAIAEEEKANAAKELNATIATEIRERQEFWVAEKYHQNYYKKNRVRYSIYRQGCGRDRRIAQLWGKSK